MSDEIDADAEVEHRVCFTSNGQPLCRGSSLATSKYVDNCTCKACLSIMRGDSTLRALYHQSRKLRSRLDQIGIDLAEIRTQAHDVATRHLSSVTPRAQRLIEDQAKLHTLLKKIDLHLLTSTFRSFVREWTSDARIYRVRSGASIRIALYNYGNAHPRHVVALIHVIYFRLPFTEVGRILNVSGTQAKYLAVKALRSIVFASQKEEIKMRSDFDDAARFVARSGLVLGDRS